MKEALDEHLLAAGEGVERAEKATIPIEASWNAYRRIDTVLNEAIAARKWADADRRVLRENMRALTVEQRRELIDRLMTAVNTDQVTVEDKVF